MDLKAGLGPRFFTVNNLSLENSVNAVTESKDISFISVENQSQDFPKHVHDTFCISLIKSGIEKIEWETDFLYSDQHCITITNPYEVHANPLVDKDVKVSFDTIYISPEFMASAGKPEMEFLTRQIRDPQLNRSFVSLLESLKTGENPRSNRLLTDFLDQLFPYSQRAEREHKSSFHSEYLVELIAFIEHNLDNKIYLDELAQIVHLNKFSFAKKFRGLTGMSPMSYVLMKKVFSAKAQFTADCDITDLAYAYNFTDAAHFSHAFKKYVGVSPKEYRDQLKP